MKTEGSQPTLTSSSIVADEGRCGDRLDTLRFEPECQAADEAGAQTLALEGGGHGHRVDEPIRLWFVMPDEWQAEGVSPEHGPGSCFDQPPAAPVHHLVLASVGPIERKVIEVSKLVLR
jgi:hypothetical protein